LGGGCMSRDSNRSVPRVIHTKYQFISRGDVKLQMRQF
jgi:hypothetical protein